MSLRDLIFSQSQASVTGDNAGHVSAYARAERDSGSDESDEDTNELAEYKVGSLHLSGVPGLSAPMGCLPKLYAESSVVKSVRGRARLHRHDDCGRGHLPGYDGFGYFPRPDHSLPVAYREMLTRVFVQCSHKRDYVHAMEALRVLSTNGSVETQQLLIFLNLLLSNPSVSIEESLELLRSVVVPRCVQKRINAHGDELRREHMLALFVQIYVSHGHLDEAQELLQARMADSVYASSPLFESYAAIILCLKVIKLAYQGTDVHLGADRAIDATNGIIRRKEALAPCLAEVIANPLLFAVSCRVVSEQTVSGSGALGFFDGSQYEAKQALGDCRTRLRDAVQAQYADKTRQSQIHSTVLGLGPGLGLGSNSSSQTERGSGNVPLKFFSLDLQVLYVALLHGVGNPADSVKSVARLLTSAQEDRATMATASGATGYVSSTADSDVHCLVRLQVRYHCLFERQHARKERAGPASGAVGSASSSYCAKTGASASGKSGLDVKCSKRLLQLMIRWVTVHSEGGDQQAVYCALLLYQLGQLSKGQLFRRLMRAIDSLGVSSSPSYKWSLWRSAACLLGRLGELKVAVDAAVAPGNRYNTHIRDVLMGGKSTTEATVMEPVADPAESEEEKAEASSRRELSEICCEYAHWNVSTFAPSQFSELSWGLTEPEVELLLSRLLSPYASLFSPQSTDKDDPGIVASRELLQRYIQLQGVLIGLGTDGRRVGPVRSRLGMAGWTITPRVHMGPGMNLSPSMNLLKHCLTDMTALDIYRRANARRPEYLQQNAFSKVVSNHNIGQSHHSKNKSDSSSSDSESESESESDAQRGLYSHGKRSFGQIQHSSSSQKQCLVLGADDMITDMDSDADARSSGNGDEAWLQHSLFSRMYDSGLLIDASTVCPENEHTSDNDDDERTIRRLDDKYCLHGELLRIGGMGTANGTGSDGITLSPAFAVFAGELDELPSLRPDAPVLCAAGLHGSHNNNINNNNINNANNNNTNNTNNDNSSASEDSSDDDTDVDHTAVAASAVRVPAAGIPTTSTTTSTSGTAGRRAKGAGTAYYTTYSHGAMRNMLYQRRCRSAQESEGGGRGRGRGRGNGSTGRGRGGAAAVNVSYTTSNPFWPDFLGQVHTNKVPLRDILHSSGVPMHASSSGAGGTRVDAAAAEASPHDLEILMFKIIVACHVLSSAGSGSVNGHQQQQSSSSAPLVISQDFLYVIKGIQILCSHGEHGAPYLALLQDYFNVNIVRAIRLGNLLYNCGAQCSTSAVI